MKHFKLTSESKVNEFGIKLFRIVCVKECQWTSVGDKGGWVQSEENLSDEAWIGHEAEVWGNAKVYGNAWVGEYAKVYGNAEVYGSAYVNGKAKIYGNSKVYGESMIWGKAEVYDNAKVHGDSYLADNVKIYGDAKVVIIGAGNAKVCGEVCIDCLPTLEDNALIKSDDDYCYFQSFGQYNKKITAFKTDDSTVKINHGPFTGTCDEFVDHVMEICESDKFKKEYIAIMDVIQAKFEK